VPGLELVGIEMELLEGFGALVAVPGIGEKNAADIPEDGANFGQEIPPTRSGLDRV
jgi:hypothetical protein